LQLLVEGNEPAAALMRQTVDAHRELLHWLDGNVPTEHGDNLVALHRHFYEAARRESGLQARAVTLAFKDFVQRRRGKILVGPWGSGAPLDEKLYGLKGIELVSIATLKGRVTIPFRVAGYGAEWNGKSPARLVAAGREEKKSFASLVSAPSPYPPPAGGRGKKKVGEGDLELLIAVSLSVVVGVTSG
jgi:hypothetical protein